MSHSHLALLPGFLAAVLLVAPPDDAAKKRDAAKGRPAATATKKLEAKVDPRVELMSLIFRLAGSDEYNMRYSKSPYADEVEAHFGKFRDHAVVKLAKKLRAMDGVSYDAVMSMAVHLRGTRSLELKIPLKDAPKRLDERWSRRQADKFLKRARSFVKESGFNAFFKQHRKLYDAAAKRLQAKLDAHDCVAWFDQFFGKHANATFHVYVGMLNGGGNYGVGVRYADGREEITPVIGASAFDADGIPVFSDGVMSTVVHEICHSYTNRIVDQFAEELEPPAARLFATCRETMRRQAYGSPRTLLYESLVRACCVRWAKATGGEQSAQAAIASEHSRGFVWIGELSKLLGKYEKNRDKYPTLEAFMPKVVAFFADYAKHPPENPSENESAEAPANAPKVVRMVPANGAQDVNPNLKVIKVYFDRPMKDGCWSVVGGGPHYPDTKGQVHYDATRKVFTIPVRLKPDWSYQFWLNRNQFTAFQSEEGVPLPSVEVNFKTRKEQ